MSAITKVYMVRHVQAMGIVRRVFQGHTDEEVSPLGQEQLSGLQEYFKEIPLDKVYCSPLIRTTRTAKAVAGERPVPVIAEDGLIEIYAGELENRPWTELEQAYPEQMRHWGPSYHLFCPPGGESFAQVYERAVHTMTRLMQANQGQTIAVATHGGFMRAFMTYVHYRNIEKMSVSDWYKNASVTLFTYNHEKDQFSVIFENNRDFLDERLKN